MRPSRGFPREQRLTRGSEMEAVRMEGKRVRTGAIETRALASPHAFPRVGFIVPRYKHSAVDRNRLKRRLRELVRLEVLPVLPPSDVILRALPHAYARDHGALRDEILRLVRQLQAVVPTLAPRP